MSERTVPIVWRRRLSAVGSPTAKLLPDRPSSLDLHAAALPCHPFQVDSEQKKFMLTCYSLCLLYLLWPSTRIGWGIKSASFSCCYVHNRYIAYIFLLFAKFAPSRSRRPCRLLFDASTSWRRCMGNGTGLVACGRTRATRITYGSCSTHRHAFFLGLSSFRL